MKLLTVHINGFKQFTNASFDFESQNSSSPFGLLVGFNGAGKTTFLSALYFAFHGDVLDSLDAPEQLCNDEAFAALNDGDDIQISISIDFVLNGIRYTLSRHRTIRKINGQEIKVEESAQVFNHVEKVFETPPQLWLNRAFPANLAKFLFFPGEHLTDFFDEEKFSGFVEDIRTLSGLDKLALLQDAIRGAISRIDKRIKAIPGNDKNQELIERINGCEEQIRTQTTLCSELSNKLVADELRQAELKQLLATKSSEFEGIRNLEALRSQTSDLEQNVQNASQVVTDLYTRFGWAILLKDLSQELGSKLASFQTQGALNRDWPTSSIKRLIATGRCICGCDIDSGSIEEARLKALLSQESSLESPTPYFELQDSLAPGGSLDHSFLASKIEAAWMDVTVAESKLDENLSAIKKAISQTQGTHEQVLTIQFKELVDLDASLPNLRIKKTEELANLLLMEQSLVQLQNDLAANLGSVKEHSALGRRRESLIRISLSIELDAQQLESHIKSELRKFLQENLGPIFFSADFTVTVEENFSVTISQQDSKQGLAEGQRKSLAFAIIAALTRIAGNISNKFGPGTENTGEQYPLVIDAGFAELTDYFTAYPLEWLRNSSSQVILIALPEITTRLLDLIPRDERAFLYILVNNQKAKNQVDQYWNFAGKQYPVLQFGQASSATTILKVE